MSTKRPVVSNLDFADIKDDLIEYFKSRDEFKDYEFTGSGLNLLMDILAYNTHYNALTANFMLNEMFLDTAVMRNNVVSLAKTLNYVPRSAKAATSTVTLRVPRVGGEKVYTLPAGCVFSSNAGNATALFYNIEAKTVQFDTADTFKLVDVKVHEGEIFTQRFVHTNNTSSFPSFDLQNKNIDTETINVTVNGIRYTQVTPENEGIVDVTQQSNIFFIEETRTGTHKVIFGNGTIGRALEIGDSIVVTYIITNGPNGNGILGFTVSVPGRGDVTVANETISQGGDFPETIREIKDNAPHWYQSQYRAVTEKDYEILLRKKFADIQSISVYGGEKVGNPGRVFICIRPKSSDTLSTSTKTAIANDVLNAYNLVTITPIIVDPFYIDIIPKTVVIYDDTKLVSTAPVLQSKVMALLQIFNEQYIGDFMDTFRASQLSSEIAKIDPAVVSSNTRISLKAKLTAKNLELNAYQWSYSNRLYHPVDGYNNAGGGILSSSFFRRTGRTFFSAFDEDGSGNVRLYDWIDGRKVYVNEKAGLINYVTGQIDIITDFDPEDGTIEFTVIPESFDVQSQNNSILRIDTSAASVSVVEMKNTTAIQNINLSRSA